MHCASSRFLTELSIPKLEKIVYTLWHVWRKITNTMMKLQGCRGSLTSWTYLPCTPLLDFKKKQSHQPPAAKSLEGSEECKLAYHQKLLSKNDVSLLCIMSSKMDRFSNDTTVYTCICIIDIYSSESWVMGSKPNNCDIQQFEGLLLKTDT